MCERYIMDVCSVRSKDAPYTSNTSVCRTVTRESFIIKAVCCEAVRSLPIEQVNVGRHCFKFTDYASFTGEKFTGLKKFSLFMKLRLKIYETEFATRLQC